jgi:hypothetical protein
MDTLAGVTAQIGEAAIEAALSDQRHHLACNVQHDCSLLANTADDRHGRSN